MLAISDKVEVRDNNLINIQKITFCGNTNLSISVRMRGNLVAISTLVPNFLPNGRSHTTTSTLPSDSGITARTEHIVRGQRSQNTQ